MSEVSLQIGRAGIVPLAPPTLPAPIGFSSVSGAGAGLLLLSLAGILLSSLILTAAIRRRLHLPPFWNPAVLVSLIERPG